jgi:hypothetical protein
MGLQTSIYNKNNLIKVTYKMLTFNTMASSKIKRRTGKSLALAKIDILFVLLKTNSPRKQTKSNIKKFLVLKKLVLGACG